MVRHATMYRWALRPLLFLLPPGAAHALAFGGLAPVEYLAPLRALTRAVLAPPHDPRIVVHAMGLEFATPVGLAGGFDKNALRPRALGALGFGHLELGTLTAQAQAASPAPSMFRLPADRALVNRLGFPNEGAARVAARIAARGVARGAAGFPIGISIGKSRVVPIEPIEGAIADYVESFTAVRQAASFVVVNVSSPNTKDLRAMQGADIARALFRALAAKNEEMALGRDGTSAATPRRGRDLGRPPVPLLVKVAPDLSDAQLEALLAVVEEEKLAGVVATNTTTTREGLASDSRAVEQIGDGGLSGPPLRARALEVVRRVRARLGRGVTVIGVGGVERAEDAMALVRAGADLVQLYTGFVYEGPGTPGRIARGLARMVEREGAKSIADLVGVPR
jgi:dihydroorotate dehydrogenase